MRYLKILSFALFTILIASCSGKDDIHDNKELHNLDKEAGELVNKKEMTDEDISQGVEIIIKAQGIAADYAIDLAEKCTTMEEFERKTQEIENNYLNIQELYVYLQNNRSRLSSIQKNKLATSHKEKKQKLMKLIENLK